jgi:hypothetical protein
VHCVGAVLFQVGYADTSLDVKTARYKRGGLLMRLGAVGIAVACGSFAYDLFAKK